MSSAVSLVPTQKPTSKKRRPAFRPGAGSRKKPTTKKTQPEQKEVPKPVDENKTPEDVAAKQAQLEQEEVLKPHDENDPPVDVMEEEPMEETKEEVSPKPVEQPVAKGRPKCRNKITIAANRNDKDVQNNEAKSKDDENESPADVVEEEPMEKTKEEDPPKPVEQPAAKRRPVRRKKITIATKRNLKDEPPENAMEEEPKEETKGEDPPKPVEQPAAKGRPKRRNKITIAANRNDNDAQDNEVNSKDDATVQTSLAIYCTKYRGEKRPAQKALPHQPPPPPPLEEEEEETPSGPQVKIVDGQIVLQETSVMMPGARKTVEEVEEEYDHVVEEEGHTTIVGASYNSFVERRKPQHWAVEETKLFYNALRQVGTDFVTMEAYYTNRSRKQLKKKYQREMVKNAKLIELALDPRNHLPVDLAVFNVDKDSIVVKKQEEVTKKGRRDPIPDPSAPVAPVIKAAQPDEQFPEEPMPPSMQDIFDDFEQLPEIAEDFALEQEEEMAMEKPAAAITLALAPTGSQKTKAKRPKFRAGKRKGK